MDVFIGNIRKSTPSDENPQDNLPLELMTLGLANQRIRDFYNQLICVLERRRSENNFLQCNLFFNFHFTGEERPSYKLNDVSDDKVDLKYTWGL